MIKFKDASPLQKKAVVSLLKIMLEAAHCDAHCRIMQDNEYLMIRQSISNPPPERRQLRLVIILNQNSFVKAKVGKIKAKTSLGAYIHFPVFFIDEINEISIDKIIAKATESTTKKPEDMDDLVWSQLPSEITGRWDRFSSTMQKHLIECVTINLTNLLAKVPDQKQTDLGVTFISPISLSVPSFLVRLPAPKQPKANDAVAPNAEVKASVVDTKIEVNKVYDLLEVLAIKQRDPHDMSRRRHPITREYFSLQEVLPASDALIELRKRAEKILEDKEAPAATVVANKEPSLSPKKQLS